MSDFGSGAPGATEGHRAGDPLGFSASRPFCLVSCVFVAAEGSGRYVDVACSATDYCVGAIAADAPRPGFAVRMLIDLAA